MLFININIININIRFIFIIYKYKYQMLDKYKTLWAYILSALSNASKYLPLGLA